MSDNVPAYTTVPTERRGKLSAEPYPPKRTRNVVYAVLSDRTFLSSKENFPRGTYLQKLNVSDMSLYYFVNVKLARICFASESKSLLSIADRYVKIIKVFGRSRT